VGAASEQRTFMKRRMTSLGDVGARAAWLPALLLPAATVDALSRLRLPHWAACRRPRPAEPPAVRVRAEPAEGAAILALSSAADALGSDSPCGRAESPVALAAGVPRPTAGCRAGDAASGVAAGAEEAARRAAVPLARAVLLLDAPRRFRTGAAADVLGTGSSMAAARRMLAAELPSAPSSLSPYKEAKSAAPLCAHAFSSSRWCSACGRAHATGHLSTEKDSSHRQAAAAAAASRIWQHLNAKGACTMTAWRAGPLP
jgi:hypothetical protein